MIRRGTDKVFVLLAAGLVVVLLAMIGSQALQIRMLQKALADIQVAPEVREGAKEAERTGQPAVVSLDITPFLRAIGTLEAEVARLRVRVEREATPPPGKTPGAVVTAPPIVAPTPEAAKAAAKQADQSVEFRGEIKTGTLSWVCLVTLVEGKCPEGQERSLPLSRPIAFDGTLIRVTPGVFVAVNVANAPFAITEVRTTTRVTEVAVPEFRLPYNLGVGAAAILTGAAQMGLVGAFYQNRVGAGYYQIGVGPALVRSPAGFSAGWGLSLSFVVPVR